MHFAQTDSIPQLIRNYLNALPAVLKSGDPAQAAQITADFEQTLEHLAATTKNRNGYPWTPDDIDGIRRLIHVINRLMPIYDLTLELIGSWLWIQGKTFPHRALLKRLNCTYSGAKAAWFFKPYTFHAPDQHTPALNPERSQFAA